MKRVGLLLVLLLAAVAVRAQCTVDNDGTVHGPTKRTEFSLGLSIITYNPCGYPNVDLEVKFEGITHDKTEDDGSPETKWNYRFVDKRPGDYNPTYTFTITRLDDPKAVQDVPKIFAEMDRMKTTHMSQHPDWHLVSDKQGAWGGVSWLTARTVTYIYPAHQEGLTPADASGRQYPNWVAPSYVTFRQIIDSRHQALYVLCTRTTNDGLDWMDSLQVAP